MDNDLRNILIKYGFSFKKAFGQNFLTDESLLDDIVVSSGVTDKDTVIEIGCGAGALTKALCKHAKKVIGYEIDYSLKPVLDEVLKDFKNVEIVYKDIMREKLADIEKSLDSYLVVANLPYYITTPIVTDFLENSKKVKGLSIMVQEEVANRFCAVCGTADYGAITVAINLRGSAKIVKRVNRQMFTPVPNVDSAVVKIDIEKNKFTNIDYNAVRNVVRCGFGNRRKMLVNNLMQTYKISRKVAEEVLNECNINTMARGETLTVEDYVNLAKKLGEI